ncbi:uncharacterized protein LDX57_002719 [Aspergillus melleus]|uniref:uncharacterized protein n=1 Tax=Aspergillus melleus TaxID=138277 RepID=UPI001E8DEAA6|nr:uncharacterized protein LDX57_002719 [Aspergillus melleus]KAH8424973.1 hypothetical protein LDX57_002719 [Aspergillus melleus]
MADLSENKKPTISELYCKCEQSFEKFTNSLKSKDCFITRFGFIKPSKILDAQTTFLNWRREHKANLPVQSPGSLEHRLRYDVMEEYRELIEENLGRLNSSLDTLVLLGQRKYDPTAVESNAYFARIAKDLKELGHLSPDLCDLEEVSDSEDSPGDTESENPESEDTTWDVGTVVKVRVAAGVSKTQVGLFDGFTKLLYNYTGHHEEQIAKKQRDWEPELDKILEMVRQWRALANVGQNINLNEEATASNSMDDIMWFCERLALANATRREVIQDPNDILHRLNKSRQNCISLDMDTSLIAPYICTSQNCSTPCDLYEGTREWRHHEMNKHRFRYICCKCSEFTTANSVKMSTHLREQHDCEFGEENDALKLSFYPGTIYENKKDTCLICLTEHSLADLYDHLAGHMEDIARLVRPSPDANTEALEALSLNDNSK